MTLSRQPRPCPVCGSAGSRVVLHRQQFAPGAIGEGYDVVACSACGAGFADGIPAQQDLDRYYAQESKYTYASTGGAESPYDFRRFERIADQIEPFLPDKAARILDIGCATGGLLESLRRRGYSRVLGADPSAGCAAAAKELHGVEVRVATLAQLSSWTETFDAVLLVGVLEHLRDVRPALEGIVPLIAPGGFLYCAQPDVEAFGECVNAPFQQFSAEHLNFFSEASLCRLMAEVGLEQASSWRWLVEWRQGITDSVVSGLFRPGKPEVNAITCNKTRPALEAYLEQSRASHASVVDRIRTLASVYPRVVLWGAGAQARRLIAEGALAPFSFSYIVDQNTHLQGTSLNGIPISSPAVLVGSKDPILICSQTFASEIRQEIRSKWGLENEVVALFETPGSPGS